MVLIDFIIAGIYNNLKTLEVSELIVIYFIIYIFARTIETITSKKVNSLFLKADTPAFNYLLLIYFLIPIYQFSICQFPTSLLGQITLTGLILIAFFFVIHTFIFGDIHKPKSNALFPRLMRRLMTKNGEDKLVKMQKIKNIDKEGITKYAQAQIPEMRDKTTSFVSHSIGSIIIFIHILEINTSLSIVISTLTLHIVIKDFKKLTTKWHHFRKGHIKVTK